MFCIFKNVNLDKYNAYDDIENIVQNKTFKFLNIPYHECEITFACLAWQFIFKFYTQSNLQKDLYEHYYIH